MTNLSILQFSFLGEIFPKSDSEAQISFEPSVLSIKLNVFFSQLNDAFTTYKKEKAENDKLLNEQIERLCGQVSDLLSQKAKLSSQLEFAFKR